VITYASETWTLKGSGKQMLLISERKMPRRIYERTRETVGTWRIKTNGELNNLVKKNNIINYSKAQRLNWFGHIYIYIYISNNERKDGPKTM
jgi:hypothetical protein